MTKYINYNAVDGLTTTSEPCAGHYPGVNAGCLVRAVMNNNDSVTYPVEQLMSELRDDQVRIQGSGDAIRRIKQFVSRNGGAGDDI